MNDRHTADEAASRLRAALNRHGLDFPELGLYLPAVMAGQLMSISTGLINIDTAERLAAILDQANPAADDTQHTAN